MIESESGHCGDCLLNDKCPTLLMRIIDDVQITGCEDIIRSEG